DHRHARRLADEGNGATGAGVDLEDEDLTLVDVELDIEQAFDAEASAESRRVIDQRLHDAGRQAKGGIHRHTVAGVYPRPLDVLHDAGNEHVFAVADGVDLDLLPLQVLVDEDGMLGGDLGGVGDIGSQGLLVVHDLHGPAAEDVGWPHQHRLAKGRAGRQRLFDAGAGAARRWWDATAADE